MEPIAEGEDRFLPTRINWVVQSGAVDFLHLMLVCMRWLMSTNIRFCLSFHDEVRYMVPDMYAEKAALAMHVTNLLTRAFCSSRFVLFFFINFNFCSLPFFVCRIGLQDLPQSVAFFTSVEIDQVLRKESKSDCETPSNPHGLHSGYGIKAGESLNILDAIQRAGGGDISKWPWHNVKTVNKS